MNIMKITIEIPGRPSPKELELIHQLNLATADRLSSERLELGNDESKSIADAVVRLLVQHDLGPDESRVFITRRQMHLALFDAGLLHRPFALQAATKWVRDHAGRGSLVGLIETKQSGDRGWLYSGPKSNPVASFSRIPASTRSR